MSQALLNFDAPPAQSHSATSRAAADSIAPAAGTLRYKLLAWLREHGPATDEQMQLGVPMTASTQRPRRCELVAAGYVIATDETRATSSGRQAVVWRAK